ncbi:hypothetical protein ACH4UM_31180 [Streptomyces sp. NPDC020801]|uniref:hypothetical protein n=1 Tax=unclassified Streptomyces TaxID=2593676 RepID=UPI00378952F8
MGGLENSERLPGPAHWANPATAFRIAKPTAEEHAEITGGQATATTMPLLTGAVVVAAPRDLLGSSRPQRATIAGTTALAVLMWGAQLVNIYYPPLGPRATHMVWAGVLAAVLLFSRRDRLAAAGLAVAALPSALQVTVPLQPFSPAGAFALLLVLLSGTVPLLRTRRHHAQVTPPSGA